MASCPMHAKDKKIYDRRVPCNVVACMGICHSSNADVAEEMMPELETAKLVLQDGELQEFARPVKASHVLQTMHPASCFVCDADDMVFDGHAPAAEELRPGKIYFVLPVSMLRRPLHAEEMAALAMKASAALVGKAMPAAVFENTISVSSKVPGAAKRRRSATNGKRRRGKGPDFSSHLGSIPE